MTNRIEALIQQNDVAGEAPAWLAPTTTLEQHRTAWRLAKEAHEIDPSPVNQRAVAKALEAVRAAMADEKAEAERIAGEQAANEEALAEVSGQIAAVDTDALVTEGVAALAAVHAWAQRCQAAQADVSALEQRRTGLLRSLGKSSNTSTMDFREPIIRRVYRDFRSDARLDGRNLEWWVTAMENFANYNGGG